MNKRIKNQILSEQELRLRLEEAQKTLLQRNEELAAAETLSHTILDQATEAIVVCNPNGQVVVANQVAQQLSGTSPLHRHFLEAFPLRLGRGEMPWHGVERRQAPRLGPAVTLDFICNGGPVQRVEVNLPRRDGFKFHLLLSAGPLLGAQGEPLGCIITLTDITQLRLAEAALREGEDRFIRLIHSDLLGILVAEEDSIREANDIFLQMVGRTRAELGLDWHAIISSEHHPLVEQKLKELLDAGYTRPFELDFQHPANGRIPVLISPILLEASPRRWVGFVVNQEERERAKAAVRLFEERFSKAFGASLDGLVINRLADGQIVEANESFEKLTGYRREELIGRRALAFDLFADPDDCARVLAQLQTQGSLRDYALQLKHKSGERREVTLSSEKMNIGGEEFVLTILHDLSELKQARAALQDSYDKMDFKVQERTAELSETNQVLEAEIAERRRVEEELRHSRALFESLLESAPDAIIAVDHAGRIVLVNSQTDKMFGYRREELAGQSIELLLPGRFRDIHVAHRTNYSRAPNTRPMGVGLDLWGRRNDGTEFPVEISLSPVRSENSALIVSIIRDVTERKRAEEQLRLSEERFRTLVEQVHDYAIFGVDSHGRVISWNDGAERLNRYRAEEIIGKHFSVFFTPEDIHSGRPDEELRVAAALGHYEAEAVRLRKDGTPYWADVVITALRDPQGNLRGFSKVIRDITARKETQEQIRELNVELERRVHELATLNQELEAFSYSVSHDLRAPLRAIAGFGQALAEDYDATLDEQGKDYTRRINAATQRLTQLIDDLLMLSRVTRSEMNLETTVDLSALANSIASQLQSVQPERRVQFVVQPGLTTHGDAHLLHIALDNLIGNAWKFTSKTPEARIEFGTAGKENGKTVYFIRDNGAGFDMAFADKLFGPFQRLHSGNEFPGTGIGLATVQRIVHRHGGRVWAEGEVGRGATVYFTL